MPAKHKEGALEVTGIVIEAVKGAFRVELDDSQHVVLAHLGGSMRKNMIRVVTGDRVKVELTPYDLNRGRIVFRAK